MEDVAQVPKASRNKTDKLLYGNHYIDCTIITMITKLIYKVSYIRNGKEIVSVFDTHRIKLD